MFNPLAFNKNDQQTQQKPPKTTHQTRGSILNEINHTTFLFSLTFPCDWFRQPQSDVSD